MKPECELEMIKKFKEERDFSNSAYAPAIVKTIVYTFIGLICVAFVAFLTAKVWPQ